MFSFCCSSNSMLRLWDLKSSSKAYIRMYIHAENIHCIHICTYQYMYIYAIYDYVAYVHTMHAPYSILKIMKSFIKLHINILTSSLRSKFSVFCSSRPISSEASTCSMMPSELSHSTQSLMNYVYASINDTKNMS